MVRELLNLRLLIFFLEFDVAENIPSTSLETGESSKGIFIPMSFSRDDNNSSLILTLVDNTPIADEYIAPNI